MGAWLFHHERLVRFAEELPPERYRCIRAEDVLNHPRREMRSICEWLGIDAGPASITAMCHPERSPFARLGPDDAKYGNDPKFVRAPKMRPAPIPPTLDVPTDWLVDPWLLVATMGMAYRFGYPDHPEAKLRRCTVPYADFPSRRRRSSAEWCAEPGPTRPTCSGCDDPRAALEEELGLELPARLHVTMVEDGRTTCASSCRWT